MQCHYRLQDIRARKVWCRFSLNGCQPLVTSVVNRSAPENQRIFLTDMGGGLLQVEMVTLQEADAGEYGCLVEGASGPHLVHTFSLEVQPKGESPSPPGPTQGCMLGQGREGIPLTAVRAAETALAWKTEITPGLLLQHFPHT